MKLQKLDLQVVVERENDIAFTLSWLRVPANDSLTQIKCEIFCGNWVYGAFCLMECCAVARWHLQRRSLFMIELKSPRFLESLCVRLWKCRWEIIGHGIDSTDNDSLWTADTNFMWKSNIARRKFTLAVTHRDSQSRSKFKSSSNYMEKCWDLHRNESPKIRLSIKCKSVDTASYFTLPCS